jgi:transmembrane sensor
MPQSPGSCVPGLRARPEAEREEFAKWYVASEEHARAWRSLGMLDQRFSRCTTGPARSALLQSRESIRRQVRKFGRGRGRSRAGVGADVFLGDHYLPMNYWLADQRTATGEQRTIRLADNTLIQPEHPQRTGCAIR